ncbi:TetR/AcrR family transcriptional regulator [Alkalicoccobacillus porphyridii]|uniref:TetR/AcrR family transcriptional regulator n=1 Tax=Alkalicoccobacillus porphyridii TaxID=2597270 RepID=A0A554A2F1_9BACI|nr:TetR/AcrR family transcriptional regulator [Alkalicoccobacillus porphyridii]TSB47826.1 TetR/AcrR family transcriptional regulator [Alkalicoccobacillus porphyridii]
MNQNNERADAARNRQAILDAALALFAETNDPATLTMNAVAEAAGVGKGTVFRRFGDRASLLRAVFDLQVDRAVQNIEYGPFPLGPDTPPIERIVAILQTIVVLKLTNRSLTQAVEAIASSSTSSPFVSKQYSYIEEKLKILLSELVPESEVIFTAHALLGATRIDLLNYLTAQENMNDDEIRQGLEAFLLRVLKK